MRPGIWLFVLYIVCYINTTYGQNEVGLELYDKKRKSSFHVQKFTDRNYFLIDAGTKFVDLELFTYEIDTTSIYVTPNLPIFVGVGASLFDVNFVINVKLPSTTENNKKFGNTSGYFLYARIFTNRFIFDLNYKQLEGFYVPAGNNILFNSNVVKLENARLVNASAKISYIFSSHKYVTGIGKRFTYRQKRSAGSFILKAAVGRYTLNRFEEMNGILEQYYENIRAENFYFNQNYFSFMAGYGHNFVIRKRFVFHIKAVLGLAYQVDPNYNNYSIGLQYDGEMSLIFDNEDWFVGIESKQEVDIFNKFNNYIIFSPQYFTITLGKRFLKNGILKQYSIFDLIPWAKSKK